MALQTSLKLVPTARYLQVQLTICNNSKQYELFDQMYCTWEDNWRCDRSGIGLAPHSCTKNNLQTIILPPGESFSHKPHWLLLRQIKPGRSTIRFGLVRRRTNYTSEEIERVYLEQVRLRADYVRKEREQNPRFDMPDKTYYFYAFRINHNGYTGQEDVFWSNAVTADIRKEWIRR
ncbi:MAG: hypothetical protein V4671_16960 [Armatimonadota bacterium]